MIRKTGAARMMSIAVASAIVCSAAGQAWAADKPIASDIQGHWAQATLERWQQDGKIHGFADGTLRPNKKATRAEVIALANSALQLSGEQDISFKDVSEKSWYYGALRTAVAEGYIGGFDDHTFRAEQMMTREQLAVIVARLLGLEPSDQPASAKDVEQLSAWSRGLVRAVIEEGLMSADAQGLFQARRNVTRAEVIVVLDRIADGAAQHTLRLQSATTFGPESGIQSQNGNVSIEADGVNLRHLAIRGDLVFGAGIGDGSVFLKGVSVEGATSVLGGGPNSIHLSDSKLGEVSVNKANGDVRLAAEGQSTVGTVTFHSGGILSDADVSSDGFGNVVIGKDAPSDSIIRLSGHYDRIDIAAPGVTLDLSGAEVSTVHAASGADNAKILLSADSSIATLEADAKVQASGEGSIHSAKLNVSGSTFENKPDTLDLNPNVTATIAGSTVSGGSASSAGGAGGGSGIGSGNNGGEEDGDGVSNSPSALKTADQLFTSAKSASAGETVELDAAPSAGSVVWLAPAGTTAFAESESMTKLAGNGVARNIVAPSIAGKYKLFVVGMDGAPVGQSSAAELTVSGELSGQVASDLFTTGQTVRAGMSVTLTKSADSGLTVWFAPSGAREFTEGPAMTSAEPGSRTLSAPAMEGEYRLYLTSSDGQVVNTSDAVLLVDNTAPKNEWFGSNRSAQGGAAIDLGTLGGDVATAWFAPAGTTAFAEGTVMTQTTGSILSAPKVEGRYKLYVLDAAGNVSAPSAGTLTVDNTAPVEQDAAFSANASAKPGQQITLNNLPDGVTAWFAPAVATSFAEGAAMTKNEGSSIAAPATSAIYQLFLVDGAGNVSRPSQATLTVSP